MPTPRKVNGNSKGEGGPKAQFFERQYDTKLEFLEGSGGFSGMDIFWNNTFQSTFNNKNNENKAQ